MAKLQMRKVEYQSSGEFNYESVGTVANNFKGYRLRFTKANLASTKRVTLIAKDKDGEEWILPCTAPLSGQIRKALNNGKSQKEILAAVAKLDIMQDDEDKYFVFQPQGEQQEEFLVEDLKKITATYDELVEW